MKTKFLTAALSAALLLGSIMRRRHQERRHEAGDRTEDGSGDNRANQQPTGSRLRFRRCRPLSRSSPSALCLANGMVVFLTENHELPLISGYAMIRGGVRFRACIEDRTGGTLRRDLAHRRHGKAHRRSAGRSAGGPRRQGGNQRRRRQYHHQLQLPEGVTSTMSSASFVDLLRHPAFREEKLAAGQRSR